MFFIKQRIGELAYSNLTDIYPAWNKDTTYIVEDDNALTNASVVRVGSFYYRSVAGNNKGFNPIEYENIKWVKLSSSNKYAMLDLESTSKSVKENGNIVVKFKQNEMMSFGIGYYEAKGIKVSILDRNNNVLWDNEFGNTLNENVIDYYSYMYEPYDDLVDRAIKVDVPVFNEYIQFEFIGLTEESQTACGYLIGGDKVDMGTTLYGINFGFNSFATKTYNEYGTIDITRAGIQDVVDFECIIDSNLLQRLRKNIREIYDDVVLFVLDERDVLTYENLITLGIIQNANVILQNDDLSTVSYSIIEAI